MSLTRLSYFLVVNRSMSIQSSKAIESVTSFIIRVVRDFSHKEELVKLANVGYKRGRP